LLSLTRPPRGDFGQQRFGIRDVCAGRERFGDHRFGLASLVLELQQYEQRFLGEIRNRVGRARFGVLDQQKAGHLTLQFGHDVARFLLADAGQLHEKGVVARVDRFCDAGHRLRKRARRGLRANRGDRDQGFEEVALDRVGEAEEREVPAVAVEVEGWVNLEHHALAALHGHLLGHARRQQDIVGQTVHVEQDARVGAFDDRSADA